MTTFSCPNCQHHVHLPEGTSPTALLQCPLCGHTTAASELIQSVGPTWVILDPGQPIAAESLEVNQATGEEKLVSSNPSPATTEVTAADEAANENLPKADRTRKQPIKQEDWGKFKPISHDEFQRRKRKSGSPLQGMLQVGLGGVMALPIAQLLIWHVLGKDPFDLAPKVGAYAPWIVPNKFRPYQADNEDRFSERSRPNRSSNKSGSGIGRDFDAELADSLAESERLPGEKKDKQPLAKDLKEERKSAGDNSTASSPVEKNMPTPPSVDVEAVSKDAPLSDSEKLTQALANTRQAMKDWKTIAKENGGDKKKIANEFYTGLTNVTEQYAKVAAEPSARIMKREVEKLLRDVLEDAELLQLVRAGGFSKLSKSENLVPPGTPLALIASFRAADTSSPATETEPAADATTESESKLNTESHEDPTATWSLKIRKSIVADTTETPENTLQRTAILQRDVLLGESIEGEYLILCIAKSDSAVHVDDKSKTEDSTQSKETGEAENAEQTANADTSGRDVIWFASPLP